MKYKIAAIGLDDSAFPFEQVGIDTFLPQRGEALLRQAARLVSEGYVLLFVSEECLAETPALLHSYDKEPRVAVIPFPGIAGGTGIGRQRIQDMVEKALGKNIL